MKKLNVVMMVMVSLFMVSCSDKIMTRQQTIIALEECKEAGLKPVIYKYVDDGAISRVDCLPEDDKGSIKRQER